MPVGCFVETDLRGEIMNRDIRAINKYNADITTEMQ